MNEQAGNYFRVYKSLLIFAALITGFAYGNIAAAESGFTSGELRSVRAVSRAILKGRSAERERVNKLLAADRADLKSLEESLGQLIADELNDMQEVGLSAQSTGGSAAFTPGSDPATNTGVRPAATRNSVISATVHARRTARIGKARQAITDIRKRKEDELPKWYMVWKEDKPQDARNRLVVDIAEQVEHELASMTDSSSVDIGKLRKLKKKFVLVKPETPIDDEQPTIQTRTRHRAQ